MPRAPRIFSNDHPYHITARCINKEWFKIPLPEIWDLFSNHLHFVHHAMNAKIHGFVLMNNHFHLLMSTPEANLDKIMWHLLKNVSEVISERTHRINQIFGGPYYACLLQSYHYYLHAYKYVYRNPLEAGLATRAEEYLYSTLPGLLGRSRLIIPMEEDFVLFGNIESTLEWLNTTYRTENKEDVRIALKKKSFVLPRDRNTRNKNELEEQLS